MSICSILHKIPFPGGRAPIGHYSGWAVFSRPKVTYYLKTKARCNLWQWDEVDKIGLWGLGIIQVFIFTSNRDYILYTLFIIFAIISSWHFFSFNIMSHLVFIRINIISSWRFFYFSTFCPVLRLLPSFVYPSSLFAIQRFFLSTFFTFHCFSHSMFRLLTFLPLASYMTPSTW